MAYVQRLLTVHAFCASPLFLRSLDFQLAKSASSVIITKIMFTKEEDNQVPLKIRFMGANLNVKLTHF